jgi:hypothetical protein
LHRLTSSGWGLLTFCVLCALSRLDRYVLSADDLDDLEGAIEEKRKEWVRDDKLTELKLPKEYKMDYALAIHVYTLETPRVYAALNRAMFNPDRRKPGASGDNISAELRAVLPFAKYLDEALDKLPARYIYTGVVRRGVKWVYPKPSEHKEVGPKGYFKRGAELLWYEFKSTSQSLEVMTRPHFCGVDAGPRTIFEVEATKGYDIAPFSVFQGEASEHEVLFRPLSRFKVINAVKSILDPFEEKSLARSGYPDTVSLEQLE